MSTQVADVQKSGEPALDRSPELSLRTVANLVRYLVERTDEHTAREVLAAGGVSLEQAQRGSEWISVSQVAAILARAFERLGRSEEAFVNACAYRAREAFGPFAYVTWAASPGAIMEVAVRASKFFSRVTSGRIIEHGPGRLVLRHTSKVPETRLLCLSRHGVLGSVPTIWGLPPAVVEDRKCLAWGDDCCEYVITWQVPSTHFWTLLGAAVGIGAAVALAVGAHLSVTSVVVLPALGTIGGYVADEGGRRKVRVTQIAELRDGLARLSREADEAQREFSAAGERQRKRLAEVEVELEESSANVQRLVGELERARETELSRAVSTGIPPLTVLRSNTETFALACQSGARFDPALVEQQLEAVEKLEEMLVSLREFAWGRAEAPSLRLVREDISRLRARLARRVAAFAFGRAVRAEVAAQEGDVDSRTIHTDTALLDFVLDNVLTRAVEADASGRIDIELAVDDDELVIRIEHGGTRLTGDGEDELLQMVTRVLEMLRAKLEIGRASRGGTRLTVHVPMEYERAPVLSRSEIVLRSS